jgi:acetate kinase
VNDGDRRVVALNAGSSSIKAAMLRVGDEGVVRERTATIAGIGGDAVLRVVGAHRPREERRALPDQASALALALDAVTEESGPPDAVGHRIVHGGLDHAGPALVDRALVAALRRLSPLAPLHQEAGLRGIALVAELLPDTPQVACFDTSFHRSMPLEAQRLPLPTHLFEAGIRRYGFHGLSCEHVVDSLGERRLGRAIIAHLGSGASLTAVRRGRSVDTTMSFTPSGGLLMATRSGDLDPSVLLYLLEHEGYDASALAHLVEHESGLAGVSGTTGDMQALLERRDGDPAASLAIDLFCRDVRKHVGALAAVLGGMDTLVFTGGIGERAPAVRAAICQPLGHLGVEIDHARNAQGSPVISSDASACRVRIVPADEEEVIARHAVRIAFPVAV